MIELDLTVGSCDSELCHDRHIVCAERFVIQNDDV